MQTSRLPLASAVVGSLILSCLALKGSPKRALSLSKETVPIPWILKVCLLPASWSGDRSSDRCMFSSAVVVDVFSSKINDAGDFQQRKSYFHFGMEVFFQVRPEVLLSGKVHYLREFSDLLPSFLCVEKLSFLLPNLR